MTRYPIRCTLTDAQQARRQQHLQEELFAGLEEAVRLDDGYALRFPGERIWLERAAGVMALERECCPFLLMELRAEPEAGAVWLSMRGPEGTVAFLRDVFLGCGVSV